MLNMQSLKIILAAVIVMIATNFLTSCSLQRSSSVGIERLEQAQELKKSVSMELQEIKGAGDINVRILLINPEGKAITSAQTWLAFNPDVLEGLKIDTQNSAFELTAPYDNDFDQNLGLVMIGRSSQKALKDTEIVVADLSFKRVGQGAAMIDAYDYKHDLSGHVSANVMEGNTPYNILLTPVSPLFSSNQ